MFCYITTGHPEILLSALQTSLIRTAFDYYLFSSLLRGAHEGRLLHGGLAPGGSPANSLLAFKGRVAAVLAQSRIG